MSELLTQTDHSKAPKYVSELAWSKVPPHALDMEAAVLGCCMLEKDAFMATIGIIPDPEYFYLEAHQKVYAAMLDMQVAGTPIDLLTITAELTKRDQLGSVGGHYFITKLAGDVRSTARVDIYARVVAEKYMARELIKQCGQAINSAYDPGVDILDLIDFTRYSVENIVKDLGSSGDAPIGVVYREMLQDLESQRNNKSALTGLDTGLYELNRITNGWQKTDLIIIGARPSKGKTALALNLALSAAISTIVQGVGVGVFSLEMSSKQLVKRMAATVTGIDFGKIISGNLDEQEFLTTIQKEKYFHSLPIRMADRTFSLVQIVAKSKIWVEKYGIELIIIDYLQLIKASRQAGANREQEVSGISRDLKLLAKELDVPIILLCQLNRAVEGRGSPEPQPSDLRESGGIEQDADVIIFPWHGEEESYISVAKNRNGQTAVKENAIKVAFSGSIQKWMDKEAFTAFKAPDEPYNPRAGIKNNYNINQHHEPFKDEDAPF